MFIHKVFLSWLIYLIIVIMTGVGLCYLNIPQIAIFSDHSYLTSVLLGMYVLAEVISAIQAWKISKEHVIASKANEWLHNNKLKFFMIDGNGVFLVNEKEEIYLVEPSETALHMQALSDMAIGGNHVNQSILLDVLADRLDSKISIVEFVSSRVVWVGILATILGVIFAFWPLLGGGLDVETIRLKLGGFFSGIAVAFIPTAASFVFKLALDFGTKILSGGSAEIVNILARVGETKLLPYLEHSARNKE